MSVQLTDKEPSWFSPCLSVFLVCCPLRHEILGLLCKNPPFTKTTDSALCNEALVDQLWKLMNSGETHTPIPVQFMKDILLSLGQWSFPPVTSWIRFSWKTAMIKRSCASKMWAAQLSGPFWRYSITEYWIQNASNNMKVLVFGFFTQEQITA